MLVLVLVLMLVLLVLVIVLVLIISLIIMLITNVPFSKVVRSFRFEFVILFARVHFVFKTVRRFPKFDFLEFSDFFKNRFLGIPRGPWGAQGIEFKAKKQVWQKNEKSHKSHKIPLKTCIRLFFCYTCNPG